MKNKKAQEEMRLFVLYALIAVIIFGVLFYFVYSTGKGEAVKKQVLAKQIALLIDAAKPDTQIAIRKETFFVSVQGSTVAVKSNEQEKGYTYDFFSKNNVQLEDQGEILLIKISS